MKIVYVLLLSVFFAQAAEVDFKAGPMIQLYKEGNFKRVCKEGMHRYYAGNHEGHFVAMVGMACARTDAINALGILQRNLVQTPALRSSATYFSTLVLAKRLLYQHFIDGVSLEAYTLPAYEHILITLFKHVREGDFEQTTAKMTSMEDGNRTILVTVTDDVPAKLLVDEYEGAVLMQRHWYQ